MRQVRANEGSSPAFRNHVEIDGLTGAAGREIHKKIEAAWIRDATGMSLDAMRWAFEQNVKPATRKFVLVALADQVRKGSECWPSIGTISRSTGVSRRSVIDHLSELEETGLISRELRAGTGKGRQSNLYTLNMHQKEREQSADFAHCQEGENAPKQSADFAHCGKVQISHIGGQSANLALAKCKSRTGQSADFAPEPLKDKDIKDLKDKPPTPLIELPEFIDPEIWTDFVQHRKEIKKKLTPTASSRLLKKLAQEHEAGKDVNAAISRSIENGWQGVFFEDKPKRKGDLSDRNEQAIKEAMQ